MTRSTQEHRLAAQRAQSFVGHDNARVSDLARSVVRWTRAREQVESDILAARRAGTSWAVIAGILNISVNSAWSQYRHLESESA